MAANPYKPYTAAWARRQREINAQRQRSGPIKVTGKKGGKLSPVRRVAGTDSPPPAPVTPRAPAVPRVPPSASRKKPTTGGTPGPFTPPPRRGFMAVGDLGAGGAGGFNPGGLIVKGGIALLDRIISGEGFDARLKKYGEDYKKWFSELDEQGRQQEVRRQKQHEWDNQLNEYERAEYGNDIDAWLRATGGLPTINSRGEVTRPTETTQQPGGETQPTGTGETGGDGGTAPTAGQPLVETDGKIKLGSGTYTNDQLAAIYGTLWRIAVREGGEPPAGDPPEGGTGTKTDPYRFAVETIEKLTNPHTPYTAAWAKRQREINAAKKAAADAKKIHDSGVTFRAEGTAEGEGDGDGNVKPVYDTGAVFRGGVTYGRGGTTYGTGGTQRRTGGGGEGGGTGGTNLVTTGDNGGGGTVRVVDRVFDMLSRGGGAGGSGGAGGQGGAGGIGYGGAGGSATGGNARIGDINVNPQANNQNTFNPSIVFNQPDPGYTGYTIGPEAEWRGRLTSMLTGGSPELRRYASNMLARGFQGSGLSPMGLLGSRAFLPGNGGGGGGGGFPIPNPGQGGGGGAPPTFPNQGGGGLFGRVGDVVGGLAGSFTGAGAGRDSRQWGSQQSNAWAPAMEAAQRHLDTRLYQQNPHLDRMADIVGDRADRRAMLGGRFGSGAHAGHVARAIAPLYAQDWQNQNQHALQAIGQFGNLQRTGYWDQANKGAIQPVRNMLGNIFGGGG